MGNTQGEHLTPYEPSRECIPQQGCHGALWALGPTPRWAALVSWRWAAVFIGGVPCGSHGHPRGTRNRQVVPGSPRPRWPPYRGSFWSVLLVNLLVFIHLLVNLLVFLLILLVNLLIFWDWIACKLITLFVIFFHAIISHDYRFFLEVPRFEEVQDPDSSPRREEVGRRTLRDYGGFRLPFFYRARFHLWSS